jgi:cytochrome d ubiquinol oxidase subunit II
VGIILIGIALGSLFTGGNFVRDTMNFSAWTLPSYGLEAALHPFNMAFGLTLFFLARVQAELYFINNIDDEGILINAKHQLVKDALLFLGFFVAVIVMLLVMSGFEYTTNGDVSIVTFKFLKNFLATPVLIVTFLSGTLLVVYAIVNTLFKQSRQGVFLSGLGTILVVTSLLCLLGFNATPIYPSLSHLASSLSIENSSSSHYTLTAMSYVSLGVPFVLGYIYIVWRAMDKTKITSAEIEADSHHY